MRIGAGPGWPSCKVAGEQLRCSLQWLGGAEASDAFAQQVWLAAGTAMGQGSCAMS